MILIGIRQASINKLARGKRFLLAIPFLMRLLNYVLCRRDERMSVEIKARDRSRIGDSVSISQRRDRRIGAVAGRMTYFNSLL